MLKEKTINGTRYVLVEIHEGETQKSAVGRAFQVALREIQYDLTCQNPRCPLPDKRYQYHSKKRKYCSTNCQTMHWRQKQAELGLKRTRSGFVRPDGTPVPFRRKGEGRLMPSPTESAREEDRDDATTGVATGASPST